MSEIQLTLRINIRRWEIDFALVDENGEIIESSILVLAKPVSIETVRTYIKNHMYWMADSLQHALYIWEGNDGTTGRDATED